MPWMVTNAYIPQIAEIESLPQELLDAILALLTPDEWKILRLSSRLLEDSAAPFLFRTIRLSVLRDHHDAFFEISRSSRLSQLPEQIVWHEGDFNDLTEQKGIFVDHWNMVHRDLFPEGLEQRPVWEITCYEQLSSLSSDRWIRCEDLVDMSTGQFQVNEALQYFLRQFSTALAHMPNIKTLISRPWPGDFVLSDTEYQITAGIVPCAEPRLGNLGLISMLEYLLATVNNRIEALYWADSQTFSSCKYLTEASKGAFRYLTSIDLCLSSIEGQQDPQQSYYLSVRRERLGALETML